MTTTTFSESFASIAGGPVASLRLPVRAAVSVIIPCYNEERFIGKALETLADQYDKADYEIVVVDGMSEDHTRQVIAEFQQSHPEVSLTLVDNPARNIPRALNLGIAAARSEIIARMDAHAAPSSGYIRRCVEVLGEGKAAVVGMPCRVRPGAQTIVGRAIAIAVSHPFGIGDAKYRLGDGDGKASGERRATQEEVDTVAFACFRKSLWSALGGFDEKLLANEDYDFNYRVRLAGGLVILDRSAHCDYFARETLARLASQYSRYGAWKARMIRQRPRSLKLRQCVAPAFVASVIVLSAAGFWRSGAWQLLVLELGAYLLAAIGFGLQGVRQAVKKSRQDRLLGVLLMPLVFSTIHFSWGASFLMGLVRSQRAPTADGR